MVWSWCFWCTQNSCRYRQRGGQRKHTAFCWHHTELRMWCMDFPCLSLTLQTWADDKIYVVQTLMAIWKVQFSVYVLPCYVKGSLLPFFGTEHKSYTSKLFHMNVVPRDTGLLQESLRWLPTNKNKVNHVCTTTTRTPDPCSCRQEFCLCNTHAPLSLNSFCHPQFSPKHNTHSPPICYSLKISITTSHM